MSAAQAHWRFLIRAARRYSAFFWGTVVLLTLASFAWIGFAWAIKQILNGIVARDHGMLVSGFVAIIIATVVQPASSAGTNYLRERYGIAVTRSMRIGMFQRLMDAPMKLYDSYQVGDLQSRLLSDSGTVERLLAGALVTLIQQPLLAAMSFGYLLVLNPTFGLVIGAVGPVIYFLNKLYAPRLYSLSRAASVANGRITHLTGETLRGVLTVKALQAERTVSGMFSERIDEQIHARIREWVTSRSLEFISTWLFLLPFVLILTVGGWWAFEGKVSVGTLIASAQLMNFVTGPFSSVGAAWRDLQQGFASLDRMEEVMGKDDKDVLYSAMVAGSTCAATDNPDRDEPAEEVAQPPRIALRDVDFSYANGMHAVNSLTCTFESGSVTAVTGPNGSGKSSVTKLLLKLYDADSGAITWDGVEYSQMSADWIRSRVCYVSQDPFLLDATVKENLEFAKEGVSPDEIRRALSRAGLPPTEDFAARDVGENGRRLSGGQRTRLALARGFLKNARLLILDEPTSSLDVEGVQDVAEFLREIRGKVTVVVVSHEDALIKAADSVIYLDRGAIRVEAASD